LEHALENKFLLFLEHDADNELVELIKTVKGIRCKESFRFKDYFNS
jgi:hypothetical protein